jgi:hypothetical protein
LKTVMFDVDGVLADFTYAFTKEAGIEPVSSSEQEHWDIPQVPRDLFRETWKKVITVPWWWTSLPCIASRQDIDALRALTMEPDYQVVFCTNREGNPNPQRQTRFWLSELDIVANVVLSKRKGDVARAIDAAYAIDDKPENVACIHWIADSKPCKSYVLDRPYNREFKLPSKVRRVYSVAEFINDVRKGV